MWEPALVVEDCTRYVLLVELVVPLPTVSTQHTPNPEKQPVNIFVMKYFSGIVNIF